MADIMILVSGATGKVGTALVAELQAQGLAFRALAHSAASYERLRAQQIDATRIDDGQEALLAGAFAGVERFFLLTPSSPDQATVEGRLVDAARAAGVRQIVKLSVLGAGDPEVSLFGSHLQSEQHIRQSGIGYTFLRPNLFAQNLGSVDVATITQQRAIFNAAGDGRVSFIDVRDIAAVAVAALRDDRHLGQTYDLTGPEALSYGAVAEKLSALLEQAVQYVALSDDDYRAALGAAGLPGWYADGLRDLFRFYRAGKGAVVTDAVTQILDRPARTIDDYLAEHRALFA